MARINTNVASLTAQRGLSKSQRTLNDSFSVDQSPLKARSPHLTTGLRQTCRAEQLPPPLRSFGPSMRSEAASECWCTACLRRCCRVCPLHRPRAP